MKNSFRTKSLLMKSSRRFEIDGYDVLAKEPQRNLGTAQKSTNF